MYVVSPSARGKSLCGWYATAMIALLLVCYWPTITGTAQLLFQTEDMAHAILAPLIAAYIVWSRRCEWRASEIAPDIRGGALLVAGAVIATAAGIGESLTLARVALLVSLTGCLLVTCGTKMLRLQAFPLSLLLFTFPIPSPLHEKLTLPLQAIGSHGAEAVLQLLHIPVFRRGDLLYLPSQIVVVSQECSGIQGLVTLTFFCSVYSYWNERGIWPRAAVTAAAIPASIFMNTIRIALTGLLGEWNHKYTAGAWHTALGYITLVLGFCLVWGVHTLLSRTLRRQVPSV
jgi:exosortase